MKSNSIQYYDFRGFRFDPGGCRLLRDETAIPLTKKCAELLLVLIESRHRTLTKSELLNTVWDGCFVEEATLTQHIYLLRRALGREGGKFIQVVPKLGYRFTAEVAEVRFNEDANRPSAEVDRSVATHVEAGQIPSPANLGGPQATGSGLVPFAAHAYRPKLNRVLVGGLMLVAIFLFRGDTRKIPGPPAIVPTSNPTGLSRNPEANRNYYLGLQGWDTGSEEGLLAAIPYFEKAIKEDPHFALAYADLADTYALIGHYEISAIPKPEALARARQFATIARDLDPNCSEALTALAIVEANEGRLDESLRLLSTAIREKPRNPIPHQRLAWLYASTGKMDQALASMTTAQKLSPQSHSLNLGLAALLNILERPIDSMQYSRRVLELDGNNAKARLELVEALEQIKGYDLALAELGKIPASQKAYTEARVVSSRLYAKTNRFGQARAVLNDALLVPGIENLGYQVALTYNAIGQPDAALAWMEKSAKRDPNLYVVGPAGHDH